MSQSELFSRSYDVAPELLLDLVQQALAAMPTVTSFERAEAGDAIAFTTSFTWTSWGEHMVATVRADGEGGATMVVSGEPRVGLLSNPWGEELHAATIEAQLVAAVEPTLVLARTNPVLALQADHRRVEALFARIAATGGDERAALVDELIGTLRVHMDLEEGHVYPLLGSEVDSGLAEQAETEHLLAREGLDRLAELSPDQPGFDGALAMVVAGVEQHVLEEETTAFPRLVAELGPQRLAELAEELERARSQLLAQAGDGEG